MPEDGEKKPWWESSIPAIGLTMAMIAQIVVFTIHDTNQSNAIVTLEDKVETIDSKFTDKFAERKIARDQVDEVQNRRLDNFDDRLRPVETSIQSISSSLAFLRDGFTDINRKLDWITGAPTSRTKPDGVN